MLLMLLSLLAFTGPALWLIRPHRLAYGGWLAALPPLVATIWLVSQMSAVAQGAFVTESYAWAEAFGLSLDLRLDGLALLFGLIIAGIGTCIAVYTAFYFEGDERLGYFYALLFLFMASMLGLVWADNLLALFVFWEGTSITSYLLISFKLADKTAVEGARRALLVTGLGALAMLAGMVLLAQIAGTYSVSDLLAQPASSLTGDPLYPAALMLILLGAFTKSAQFPFHFWLPGAMSAPTPASAYLHSATMVKAGVYLLARLHPALSDHALWFWGLFAVGSCTMLLGALSALRYDDIKAVLAYATVSQLGVLVLLLAFDTQEAYIAAVVGILAHALYKGPFFLVAGIIDHATGTRDLRRLAGLGRTLPWVATTAVLAGVSMAGLPPTFGFLAKETLLETVFAFTANEAALVGWLGVAMVGLAGALFVAYSLILLWEPFFRSHAPAEEAHVHHATSFFFLAPALALVLVGVAIPFTLGIVEKALFAAPASAIAGGAVEVHLALWHGFTPAFLTSLTAIAAGVGIFLLRNQVRALFAQAPVWLDGVYWFDRVIDSINTLAGWTTRTVQGGSLAGQASITLLCAFAAVIYALFHLDFVIYPRAHWATLPSFAGVVLVVLAIVAAIVTVRTRDRLSAIISLGVVGVVVTLFFVFFGAPDLALTQLLIEVLTVVLLVLVFYRIPSRTHPAMSATLRIRNLLVAGAAAAWGFVLVLLTVDGPLLPRISDFFLLNSAPAAHGGNVVNVILVDFRGFDTMGEITVLAIAAVGGYALLRASRLRPTPPQRVVLVDPMAEDSGVEPPAVVTKEVQRA